MKPGLYEILSTTTPTPKKKKERKMEKELGEGWKEEKEGIPGGFQTNASHKHIS